MGMSNIIILYWERRTQKVHKFMCTSVYFNTYIHTCTWQIRVVCECACDCLVWCWAVCSFYYGYTHPYTPTRMHSFRCVAMCMVSCIHSFPYTVFFNVTLKLIIHPVSAVCYIFMLLMYDKCFILYCKCCCFITFRLFFSCFLQRCLVLKLLLLWFE